MTQIGSKCLPHFDPDCSHCGRPYGCRRPDSTVLQSRCCCRWAADTGLLRPSLTPAQFCRQPHRTHPGCIRNHFIIRVYDAVLPCAALQRPPVQLVGGTGPIVRHADRWTLFFCRATADQPPTWICVRCPFLGGEFCTLSRRRHSFRSTILWCAHCTDMEFSGLHT